MATADTIRHGSVVWVSLDPVRGREQSGYRPALVIASDDYLDVVDTLAIVMPITSTNRGWPNHVPVSGTTTLPAESFVMTEQVRTISRDRITSVAGTASSECLQQVRMWLGDFLGL